MKKSILIVLVLIVAIFAFQNAGRVSRKPSDSQGTSSGGSAPYCPQGTEDMASYFLQPPNTQVGTGLMVEVTNQPPFNGSDYARPDTRYFAYMKFGVGTPHDYEIFSVDNEKLRFLWEVNKGSWFKNGKDTRDLDSSGSASLPAGADQLRYYWSSVNQKWFLLESIAATNNDELHEVVDLEFGPGSEIIPRNFLAPSCHSDYLNSPVVVKHSFWDGSGRSIENYIYAKGIGHIGISHVERVEEYTPIPKDKGQLDAAIPGKLNTNTNIYTCEWSDNNIQIKIDGWSTRDTQIPTAKVALNPDPNNEWVGPVGSPVFIERRFNPRINVVDWYVSCVQPPLGCVKPIANPNDPLATPNFKIYPQDQTGPSQLTIFDIPTELPSALKAPANASAGVAGAALEWKAGEVLSTYAGPGKYQPLANPSFRILLISLTHPRDKP